MASIINASTSAGLVQTADTSGIIQLQSNGTTIMTVGPTGVSTQVGAPAFSAYQSSAQTLSSNTWTKIQFQTEEFDTNNNYDNTTNYRFTPTIAGYYQINSMVQVNVSSTSMTVAIYKNGIAYKAGANPSGSYSYGATANGIVYCNGATDYIEIYATLSVGQALSPTLAYTYFQAAMVRSA